MEKSGKKISSKKLVIFTLISLVFFLIIKLLFSQLVINISDSHEGTLFLKSEDFAKVDDYIYLNFSHPILPKSVKVLSKKLVCVGGQNLKIDDNFITCDQRKYKIHRNEKTKNGTRIDQFFFTGLVPNDKAVIWGNNPSSFDSRYFGFVSSIKLKKMEIIF